MTVENLNNVESTELVDVQKKLDTITTTEQANECTSTKGVEESNKEVFTFSDLKLTKAESERRCSKALGEEHMGKILKVFQNVKIDNRGITILKNLKETYTNLDNLQNLEQNPRQCASFLQRLSIALPNRSEQAGSKDTLLQQQKSYFKDLLTEFYPNNPDLVNRLIAGTKTFAIGDKPDAVTSGLSEAYLSEKRKYFSDNENVIIRNHIKHLLKFNINNNLQGQITKDISSLPNGSTTICGETYDGNGKKSKGVLIATKNSSGQFEFSTQEYEGSRKNGKEVFNYPKERAKDQSYSQLQQNLFVDPNHKGPICIDVSVSGMDGQAKHPGEITFTIDQKKYTLQMQNNQLVPLQPRTDGVRYENGTLTIPETFKNPSISFMAQAPKYADQGSDPYDEIVDINDEVNIHMTSEAVSVHENDEFKLDFGKPNDKGAAEISPADQQKVINQLQNYKGDTDFSNKIINLKTGVDDQQATQNLREYYNSDMIKDIDDTVLNYQNTHPNLYAALNNMRELTKWKCDTWKKEDEPIIQRALGTNRILQLLLLKYNDTQTVADFIENAIKKGATLNLSSSAGGESFVGKKDESRGISFSILNPEK